jgi:hypothetical protein
MSKMKTYLLLYRETVRLFERKRNALIESVTQSSLSKASPNKQTRALTVGHCVLGHDVIRTGANVHNSEEPGTYTFRTPESSRYINMAATVSTETSARFYRFARRRFGVTCNTLFFFPRA